MVVAGLVLKTIAQEIAKDGYKYLKGLPAKLRAARQKRRGPDLVVWQYDLGPDEVFDLAASALEELLATMPSDLAVRNPYGPMSQPRHAFDVVFWRYPDGLELLLEDPQYRAIMVRMLRARLAEGTSDERLMKLVRVCATHRTTVRALASAEGPKKTPGTES